MNSEEYLNKVIKLIEQSNDEIDIGNSKDIITPLSEVNDDEIISIIGMDNMPLLVFLFKLKYQNNPEIISLDNDLMIRIGDCNLANFSYLAVYLHFLSIQENKLILEGTTSYPAVIDDVEFGVRINGIDNIVPVDLDSTFDLHLGKNVYETRKRFYYEADLEDDMTISFLNVVSGIAVEYGKINSMRFSPVADVLPNQYYYKDNHIVYIQENKIHVRLIEDIERERYEEKFLESVKLNNIEKYDWIRNLRKQYWDYQKVNHPKTIFLLMDRPKNANDNARVFWEYLLDKDDIDAYFVLSRDSSDFDSMLAKGKVVELYSEEHYRLALIADYIISSQCNGVVENPFWDDSEYFRDLYHRPKSIFLQHGVIKDDMSITLNRFNTNFYGFLTSTFEEWKSIIDYPYLYTRDKVWNIGLPRFDKLYDAREKVILIMPTWRQNLMVQEWDDNSNTMSWVIRDDLVNTTYYERYSSLLNNRGLRRICKKYGYKIIFCPHPLIKPFFKCSNHDNYNVAGDSDSYTDLFAKGSLLITDYSSVAYDFLYLKKPVIYYQFDKDDFFKEHTYKPGYFDYEKERFGDVAISERILVNMIKKYLKNECELAEKHMRNVESLFDRTILHCELLLKKINKKNNVDDYGGSEMQKVDAKDLLIDDLNRENSELKECIKQLTIERDNAVFCLEETQKSITYKIGRAITFIPRKIRR